MRGKRLATSIALTTVLLLATGATIPVKAPSPNSKPMVVMIGPQLPTLPEVAATQEVTPPREETALQQDQEKPKESYGEWNNFVATFYTLSEGSGTGRTFTGTIPQENRTLAVDPNLIPLGSTVEIQYPDGAIERRVAEDTGGAIHGHILDVYVVTLKEARQRGREHVQVRIVHTP